MNKRNVLIVLGVAILSLGLIGVSYAFYQAVINQENVEEITISSGSLELELKDTNAISLPNARPGDSQEKSFTVENHGLKTSYNIKFTGIETDFVGEDLQYTLTNTDDHTITTGYINKDLVKTDSDGNKYLYLKTKIDINAKTDEEYTIHHYTLKLEFLSKNEPQNDNQGAIFKGKINIDQEEVDENGEVVVPSEQQENTFLTKLEEAEKTGQAAVDDFNNLRYIGANPNNYIWFNCLKYDDLTNENAEDEEHKCEKWQIIGLFNNVEKVNVDESTTKENLVKIIRADSIGDINWDDNNSNDWTNATLQQMLNKDSDATGYLNPGYNSKDVKGITAATKGMIEKVEWNLGGSNSSITAKEFYEKERGSMTYGSQPSTWKGYIGLMYASDYGYATAGGTNKSRQACLDYQLSGWGTGDYLTDCANTDWLKPSSSYLWTISPHSFFSHDVFFVYATGIVDDSSTEEASGVSPSLYLTSKVGIKEGGGTGEATQPYILEMVE